MHASLCGGGYLLKALGSVASFLADRLFNLSNDNDVFFPVVLSTLLPTD